MKFDLKDVTVEVSSLGPFGEGQAYRLTHNPSGQHIVKESKRGLFTAIDKDKMIADLQKLVEKTPITNLEVVKPKEKSFAELASEDKIRSLPRLYKLGKVVFKSERDMESWFLIPHELLKGETPLQACKTDEGYDHVESVLAGIYYGFPS